MSSLFVFDLIRWLFLLAGLRSGFCAREIGVGPDLAADAAVDLNLTSFSGALKKSPASYAVVEFFAHWCPACRNYKPHYEKVARLFNGPDAVHPGMVFMTRVDCAPKDRLIYSCVTGLMSGIILCYFGGHLLSLLLVDGSPTRKPRAESYLLMTGGQLSACLIGSISSWAVLLAWMMRSLKMRIIYK